MSPVQDTLSVLLPSQMQKVVLVLGPAQIPGTDPQELLPWGTLSQVTFSKVGPGRGPELNVWSPRISIRVTVPQVHGSGVCVGCLSSEPAESVPPSVLTLVQQGLKGTVGREGRRRRVRAAATRWEGEHD